MTMSGRVALDALTRSTRWRWLVMPPIFPRTNNRLLVSNIPDGTSDTAGSCRTSRSGVSLRIARVVHGLVSGPIRTRSRFDDDRKLLALIKQSAWKRSERRRWNRPRVTARNYTLVRFGACSSVPKNVRESFYFLGRNQRHNAFHRFQRNIFYEYKTRDYCVLSSSNISKNTLSRPRKDPWKDLALETSTPGMWCRSHDFRISLFLSQQLYAKSLPWVSNVFF